MAKKDERILTRYLPETIRVKLPNGNKITYRRNMLHSAMSYGASYSKATINKKAKAWRTLGVKTRIKKFGTVLKNRPVYVIYGYGYR